MDFRATNFTVTMGLLVAFTIFMMGVRSKKPLENNWPMLYWALLLFITVIRAEDTFNLPIVMVGVICGMLLRFEFLNKPFAAVFRTIETGVWLYVIYRGCMLMLAG